MITELVSWLHFAAIMNINLSAIIAASLFIRSQCFFFSPLLLSFRLSAPSRDAKPSVQLPDHSGRAANTQPRSHWQPAKQYGQPDARHDGPVPSNAVLSGIVMMTCVPKMKHKTRALKTLSVQLSSSENKYLFVFFPVSQTFFKNDLDLCCKSVFFFCSRFRCHSRRTSSQCLCPVSQDREQRWLWLACSPATACSPLTSTPP